MHRGLRIRRARIARRDLHELAHLRLQIRGEARNVRDPAVVHEIDRLRPITGDAIDRCDELFRIELRRRGRRHDERAARRIEVPIRQTEGVAGEDALTRRIDDALVMKRMTRRVNELEAATGELHVVAIVRHDDVIRRDRRDIAVELDRTAHPHTPRASQR